MKKLWAMVWTNDGDAFMVPFPVDPDLVQRIMRTDFWGSWVTRVDLKILRG